MLKVGSTLDIETTLRAVHQAYANCQAQGLWLRQKLVVELHKDHTRCWLDVELEAGAFVPKVGATLDPETTLKATKQVK